MAERATARSLDVLHSDFLATLFWQVQKRTMNPCGVRWGRILGGAFAANLLGWAVTVLYAWIFQRTMTEAPKLHEIAAISLYANLLLVPMAMGVVAAYFWQRLALRIWDYLWCSLLTVVMCVAGAYLLVKEGAVCLLIASPLLWGALFAGALIGRSIFRKVDGRLRLVVFPVVILAIFAEGKIGGERAGLVTDEIVVAAPAAEVWKHVVAFPRITAEPDYWLNKVGLPSAAETTCEGEFVGAKRECIFSDGLVFKEVVSELETHRRLTFDVTEQPNDPELLGHVTLHRGQFELRANPDGSTTLLGRSWYTLHVRPLWYFDWWTRDITREVHLRVMRHIKQLAEARG